MTQLSKPPNLVLTSLEETLIRKVHRNYAEIILEKEFGGGYGGARVFLVLPVNSNGAADVRVVTKTGSADALRNERDNYKNHIARTVPFTAAQVREYYEQDGQAALNYIFANGETLGQTVSLEEYYHTHTAQEIIRTLTGLLDKALGSRWYRESSPLHRPFRAEYGRHLPRDLDKIVTVVFSSLSSIAGDRLKIPGIAETYPHPLKVYPGLLDKLLESRRSLVHGDLHLRNVLVDESGKGWLIDFAKVEERHNLFDFIKLETYIRLMALASEYGAFSWSDYAQFEQALNASTIGQNPNPPIIGCLAKAYEVIQAIRRLAQPYMGDPRNFKTEYLPALFFYCLAMMKYYESNGAAPTQLIFITACVAAQGLREGDSHPVSAPSTPHEFQPRSKVSSPEMILIPKGKFRMGMTEQQADLLIEKIFQEDYNIEDSPESRQNLRQVLLKEPYHIAELPDFYISKYPITNKQFERFTRETQYETEAEQKRKDKTWRTYKIGKENYPVVFVSWNDALAYCEWLTRIAGHRYRLPTVEEWIKADRGPNGNLYPWGDEYDPQKCNTMESMRGFETTEVGSFEEGKSSYGVYDLVGNVDEWTHNNEGAYKVILGSSWRMACEIYGLTAFRRLSRPSESTDDLGFRCVSDV